MRRKICMLFARSDDYSFPTFQSLQFSNQLRPNFQRLVTRCMTKTHRWRILATHWLPNAFWYNIIGKRNACIVGTTCQIPWLKITYMHVYLYDYIYTYKHTDVHRYIYTSHYLPKKRIEMVDAKLSGAKFNKKWETARLVKRPVCSALNSCHPLEIRPKSDKYALRNIASKSKITEYQDQMM